MHQPVVKHVHQRRWVSSLSLISRVIKLRTRRPIGVADWNAIPIVSEEQGVDKVRSLVGKGCVEQAKLRTEQCSAGKSIVRRVIAEHGRWIE